ncbi:hypothetical protein METBIDRAFT_79482 [Metschnikowia bicuspidata var. bicuspidata NRRL YB-4993]|uniref:Mitochondrial distribution and morphology protein family 31/32 n=1 Tax=Metschnikowia bicuspidata var. bicuspidata NRRL YB-4993 TaxID=869754 RepID=A0A1A0H669_9ASCO|nr:hypothetical protein METBIDRAFT_79482 [Metschnikowia bicuspidata var. bicuspidata NRRL YB-4993]OBA19455.1 hypothetical protein METBIDRAFT_79482 [Metschnikowia bicuspidata var. bicuspidata NRRL YB-4993]
MLLQQASSPAARLWVHIRWPLTRNDRPFSVDDFSAFASWVVMGQVLWVFLGTTTFVLVAMYFINTLDQFWNTIYGDETSDGSKDKSRAKDESLLSRIAGSVLSHGLGAHIAFEKGHVLPHLEDGMLKFKNVTILLTEPSSKLASLDFSAKIAALNLSLSFKKWYEGKGLIYDLEIFGMHAKVARNDGTHTRQVMEQTIHPTFNSLALSFSGYHDSHELQNDLREHKVEELTNMAGATGFSFLDSNYELASVKIRDSFVEIHGNQDTNALNVSIFNCDLPRLRGDRLLIDFFNADIVTGTVNNSMFTIHKHQTFLDSDNTVTFKLDGIDMGSLSSANPKLKFNWLASGKAEIVADIRLPNLENLNADYESPAVATSGAFRRFLEELGNLTNPKPASNAASSGEGNLLKGALMAIYETFASSSEKKVPVRDSDYVIVNVKVKFTDLKASLPPHLPMASSVSVPFTSLQNLRSLISYINGLETERPLVIKTTVIEKLTDLYNVDNISQTKMYDAIIGDIYEEFTRMIESDEKRIMREKSTMWSHSVMSQILLLGLGVLA